MKSLVIGIVFLAIAAAVLFGSDIVHTTRPESNHIHGDSLPSAADTTGIAVDSRQESQAQLLAVSSGKNQPSLAADSNDVSSSPVMEAAQSDVAGPDSKKEPEVQDPFSYGVTKPVPLDANPDVASVAEALQSGAHPERLSLAIPAKPFDAEQWATSAKYRTKFLHTIEPGRPFATAQPSSEVPRLGRVSPYLQYVVQEGPSVTLTVKATPNAPVAYTSLDLGRFSNKLTSVTVQADDKGFARAEFYGTAGTIDDVNIVVGSPQCSGQVRFIVHVRLPEGEKTDPVPTTIHHEPSAKFATKETKQ